MKTRLIYFIIALLLSIVGFELFYSFIPLTYEATAKVMGTTVRVKVSGPGAPRYAGLAIKEIKRLEKIFSKFDENSEVSLINRLAGRAPLQLSSDTAAVLKMAEDVRRASHGAFNVRFNDSSIDLGGIGKGYAVESARRLLLKKGVKSAIIDMHSSIAVIGDGWRVAIRDPRKEQGILGIVILNNGDALSTSGQYEQPSHILDPRTGKPADRCLGVTVIANDAGLADALSTAIFVLGPVSGSDLARALKVKYILVGKNGKIYDNLGPELR
ncbi:MAG: FAD:protein FMN transferase [Candidatus Margulisbacteria bacterium]|nr:FAD:protein FMN transferase [Candidatus Margulisiibacteriota bacterium]